jgi:hypothetical protein
VFLRSHCNTDWLLQNEVGIVPFSAVLLVIVSIWRLEGNDDGKGGCRLLLSRWSSLSTDRDEILDGMVPENEFQERSLDQKIR